IPSPIASPWPRDPVATSTQGNSGIGAGCPWSGEPCLRRVRSSSSPKAPIPFSVAQRTGAAGAFDRMNRSYDGDAGPLTSNRRRAAYGNANSNATDNDELGRDEAAADIEGERS